MPTLVLRDGRVVELRCTCGRQLATASDLGGRRDRPVIVEVVAVDGRPITPTRLAVLDAQSIWLSHQAEVAPRSHGRPAAATGLSAAEAETARSLFLSLTAGPPWVRPDPARLIGWEVRRGDRIARVVFAVTVAALAGMFLVWLLFRGTSFLEPAQQVTFIVRPLVGGTWHDCLHTGSWSEAGRDRGRGSGRVRRLLRPLHA